VEQVICNKVVLLRAPPLGKTSLAKLMELYITRHANEIQVQEINLLDWQIWSNDKKKLKELKKNKLDAFEVWWKELTKETLDDSLQGKTKKVFILDEAQLLYPLGRKHSFWVILKKKQAMDNPFCCVFLLSMYGNSPDRNDDLSIGTPIKIETTFDLTDLRFTEEEFDDVINGFNRTFPQISIRKATRDRIWSSTLGHPGFVRLALDSIRDRFFDSVKLNQINWKDSIAAKYF